MSRRQDLHYEKGVAHFDIVLRAEDQVIEGCTLPMPGDHNVSNALAAVAVARHLGMKKDEIRAALAAFAGVNRRFTRVGEVNGVTIIDDYGHHPVEIAAVLKAARQASDGRVIAVHQPHRYSRLSNLFEDFCGCFNDADVVGIAEVYAAGEAPIAGADRDDSGRRADPPWPSPCPRGGRRGRSGAAGAGTGPAGRYRRLPRRRHDLGLGQWAARAAAGEGGMSPGAAGFGAAGASGGSIFSKKKCGVAAMSLPLMLGCFWALAATRDGDAADALAESGSRAAAADRGAGAAGLDRLGAWPGGSLAGAGRLRLDVPQPA